MRRTVVIAIMVLVAVSAVAQFNVQRKEQPTPEVAGMVPSGKFMSGKTHVITYTVKYWDTTAPKAQGDENCLPQSVVRVSAGVFKLTVATRAIGYSTDCGVTLSGPGVRPLYVYVPLNPDPAAKQKYDAEKEQEEKERAERSQREYEQAVAQQNDRMAAFNKFIGKRWDVKFGTGKTETWTYSGNMGMGAEFKSPDGKKVTIMPVDKPGQVMVVIGDSGCVGQAMLKAGAADGEELLEMICKGRGGKWSAKISQ